MGKIINVTSNNQKGGTTAGEINGNARPEKQGFWYKPINKYFTIPLAVIIVGGVIVYYLTNANMTDDIFNVTSNNQQGGLTVGQLNISNPQRVLTTEIKSQIISQLPSDKETPIEIIAVGGDREAYKFASEIWNYLNSEMYYLPAKIGSINTPDPIVGVTVSTKNKDKTIIIVGNVD
ncbi:MAG: hypothetical protein WC269_02310 [Candidatus Gracilibacteria bacterium]|jgi:hypothetical protein